MFDCLLNLYTVKKTTRLKKSKLKLSFHSVPQKTAFRDELFVKAAIYKKSLK